MTARTITERQSDECACTPDYRLRSTAGGYSVVRANGDYAEFLDSAEADEAMQLLRSGESSEDEYEWTEAD